VVGVGVLAVFVAHQRRTSRQGRPVLVEPALFTTRGVRPGLLGLLLVGTPYTGILFCVAADLQTRHGSDAGAAGFALLPLAALLLLAWLTRGSAGPWRRLRWCSA
jgi:hypothetical protein